METLAGVIAFLDARLFGNFDVVPVGESALRVALAALAGLAIGLDRQLKGKPMDIRAFCIVAATACVVALLSQELYQDYREAEGAIRLDFISIIEGVMTGIGFLGAGAILKGSEGERVVGTATGASIWASGGAGLALGYGFYGLTLIAVVTVLATLVLIGAVIGDRD